jgi:DNA-binding winged helix-turn-helix (wHTH) protein
VSRRGSPVDLVRNEYNLLVYFIRNAGKVLTRDEVLNAVWGYDFCPITRTVDAHVAKLRSKLEPDPRNPLYILTLHGVGYRFVISREHDATLLRLRQGYNMENWQKGEMDYWGIADITIEELEQFRVLYEM